MRERGQQVPEEGLPTAAALLARGPGTNARVGFDLYRQIFETSHDGLAVVDLTGRFVTCNAAMEALVGYSREELRAIRFEDITPERWHAVDRAKVQQLLETGCAERFEKEYRRKDGTLVPIALAGWLATGEDGETLVVCSVRDLRGERAARRALREAEERFQQLAEHVDEMFWLAEVGDPPRIIYASPASQRILGRSPESLLADPAGWMSIVHPDDRAQLAEAIDRQLRTREPVELSYRVVRADGLIRHVRVKVFPIFHDTGAVARFAGIAEDVTDQLRVAEERARLDRDLRERQRLESLSILAGGVAHDFNNLLVGILGNAGIVQEDLPEGAALRECVDDIAHAAQRAAELTGQLLAYAGRGSFQLAPLCPAELVRDTARLVKSSVSSPVRPTVTIAPELPRIRGDRTQLRQLLMNLLFNAADALEGESGRIDVGVGVERLDAARLDALLPSNARPHGRYVTITVTDTGCGMSAETRAHLFDPFFTTKFTGRGLGLAAALGIAAAHGGGLEVITAPGEGSTFRVYLPAAEEALAERDGGARPAPSAAAVRRILLVDDEPIVLALARRVLARAGHAVEEATGGADALERLAATPDAFDLVVLDLTMPGVTGLDVLAAMRERGLEVPVVLSSGFTELEARQRIEAFDVAGFVMKPYPPGALLAAVEQAFRPGG